jgi:hypothetical protein
LTEVLLAILWLRCNSNDTAGAGSDIVRLEGDAAEESYALGVWVGGESRASNPKLCSRLEVAVVNVVEGSAN